MRTLDHPMDADFEDGRERERGRDLDRGMGRGSSRSMDAADAAPHEPESRDLTLGLTALIGIFFAVVVVCAVFFGFGYSTGRTLHGTSSATAPAPSASPADGSLAHSMPAPALLSPQPPAKPSAGAPASAETAIPGKGASQALADSAAAVAGRHLAQPAALPGIASSDDAPARDASVLPAGALMVQIAAVMRPADADMLARALRANGFAAVVRTEPRDKFLHVQVGPFATRDQAKAMRARLEADGYNAFLKP